mmetsp:Transcript_1934/g.5812  ORF Transcript_1934/g.5812 Transcript_1934/m.5812 type:complete len:291 (+) Transcript_1934:157-1029(+)
MHEHCRLLLLPLPPRLRRGERRQGPLRLQARRRCVARVRRRLSRLLVRRRAQRLSAHAPVPLLLRPRHRRAVRRCVGGRRPDERRPRLRRLLRRPHRQPGRGPERTGRRGGEGRGLRARGEGGACHRRPGSEQRSGCGGAPRGRVRGHRRRVRAGADRPRRRPPAAAPLRRRRRGPARSDPDRIRASLRPARALRATGRRRLRLPVRRALQRRRQRLPEGPARSRRLPAGLASASRGALRAGGGRRRGHWLRGRQAAAAAAGGPARGRHAALQLRLAHLAVGGRRGAPTV